MTVDMPFRPLIRTQADLEHAWRHLIEPLGFSDHSIWMMLIDGDDRPIPSLTEIEGAVEPPEPEEVDGLAELMRRLRADIAPRARFAFLRSRPGGGGIDPHDRGWAQALYDAARLARVPIEVVHLATDHTLIPIPMDDFLAAG
ncbi:hypothetical protein [Nocardioides sp.]|uniref:hypothetical protein n=1 Tax=Nocardioides sp. TaxID=35761 RepID=UPI002D7E3EB7|nr:hypothetical protein [Nocardioides sp.]HET8960682.1 hypothetical protein [Nocardioides sp.]